MKKIRRLSMKDFDTIVQSFPTEAAKEALRQIRDVECYPIINRGEAWYKRLTDKQKAELDAWYQDWLDVTDTFTKPRERPTWV